MKVASTLISLLAASPAYAFTSHPKLPTHTVLHSTAVAEEVKTPSEESMIKYDTDVNTEQKFKVQEVDPKTLDPKLRVQT